MGEEIKRDGLESEHLYDPLKSYQNIYKDLHHKHVTEFFDELVEKSQVDIEANRATMKRIHQKTSKRNRIARNIRKLNTFRILMILLIFVMIGVIYFSGQSLAQSAINAWNITGIVGGLGIIILSIFF